MSMAEIAAIIETNPSLNREQSINATNMPVSMARTLKGSGIETVGALMDSDAFKAITSGRYDIDAIREVNGIPIAALRLLVDEIIHQSSLQGPLEPVPVA